MSRFIHIKGAYNMRDLGGYRNKDGKRIKEHLIYRSGKISEIVDSEIDKMKTINLKSICDFRTTSEQAKSPDRWYDLEKINRYSLPIGEGRMDQPDWIELANMGKGKNSYLYKVNRSYVRKNVDQYKSFFKILLDESNFPLLFHCTAGKDRTGFATVLLLHILGVANQTIIEDYLLTNVYLDNYGINILTKFANEAGFDINKVMPILIADEDYIQGAFDAIELDYGTIDNFISQALGVGPSEIQKLQNYFLEN